MMKDKVKEYTGKFPFGLQEFTAALSNRISLAIIYLLHEKGELSKEGIIQQFGKISKHDRILIDAAIRNLSNNGIIRRVNIKFVDARIISDFKINEIYVALLESCLQILQKRRVEKGLK